jgi:putative membrane protein
MKYAVTALTLFLAAAACSPAPEQQASTDRTEYPPPAVAPVTTETLESFVQKVSLSNMYEIEAAKIAQTRAKAAPIKAFARTMVTDHTAAGAALTAALAAEPTAPAPAATLDQAHLDKLARLREVEADKFDELYVDQQVEAHENTLSALRDYAQNGASPAVKSFAMETAPKVEQHLTSIKALDNADVDEPSKS